MPHIYMNSDQLEGDHEYVQMSPGQALDFIQDITDMLLAIHVPGIRGLRTEVRNRFDAGDVIFALSGEQADLIRYDLGLEIPEPTEYTLELVAMYAASVAEKKNHGQYS